MLVCRLKKLVSGKGENAEGCPHTTDPASSRPDGAIGRECDEGDYTYLALTRKIIYRDSRYHVKQPDKQGSNYWDILTGYRYWQVLGNSLLIAVLTVALTLAVASMAAFTFAHLRFFGDKFLLNYLQLGLLFPLATAILPLFIKVRDLGLLNSYWGVILPQVAFSLAMAVLLLRTAFKQLPSELLDAAMMDGCGYFRYFFYITLPLSGPILSTVGIIAFVGSWNGYLLPLVVLNSESRYPWTLGLMVYQGQYSTAWQLVLAFITLTILPAILMFLLAQRWIVAGLTAGAVKS